MRPPEFPKVVASLPQGRVLVLAPHPDDESLGCGGAIALHHRQGDHVKVVFVTDGGAGDPLGYYAGLDYRELRREEARRAASILGIDELVFWDYPDSRLAEAHDLSERLGRLFATSQPDILYRPSTLEVHPDHWALAVGVEAALQQYRPAYGDFCYEIWAAVQPTHALDITTVWDLKRKAVEQYESQLRYNDYIYMGAGLNTYRTIYCPSARYVEAYRLEQAQ
ncbi:MAG: PIG-L family deacetylase [bacterium]|uniref:PIG-L family deacetylase n=1 Tax=Candidatus Methylomirabilis tolerans TaxID=3123416 RepID=A0AAJ1AGC6_9BACT|nr:PIG-L family deacetylase [Candidatus Methylomirabilis sp.]